MRKYGLLYLFFLVFYWHNQFNVLFQLQLQPSVQKNKINYTFPPKKNLGRKTANTSSKEKKECELIKKKKKTVISRKVKKRYGHYSISEAAATGRTGKWKAIEEMDESAKDDVNEKKAYSKYIAFDLFLKAKNTSLCCAEFGDETLIHDWKHAKSPLAGVDYILVSRINGKDNSWRGKSPKKTGKLVVMEILLVQNNNQNSLCAYAYPQHWILDIDDRWRKIELAAFPGFEQAPIIITTLSPMIDCGMQEACWMRRNTLYSLNCPSNWRAMKSPICIHLSWMRIGSFDL
ncbi:hypothetical protein RFI_22199 [Reticulomyxa filosa]|uniref:Uncharacterized protein n=1 Tax=Reticulomyxa filosa TaxID=46433 RepID=X6MMR7_RETFI|nr:hypothetical protein RFI_22199 [Reticulomyxa filosa]|eukprot:ETO15164.1 hypothetical protein RFI_22199 [Reticulomyxa filosa]